MPLPTIEWEGDMKGRIRLIDQTLLPTELKFVYCEDMKSIWHAIKTLMVRGAPAIGIAGAMGVVLGIKDIQAKRNGYGGVCGPCDNGIRYGLCYIVERRIHNSVRRNAQHACSS